MKHFVSHRSQHKNDQVWINVVTENHHHLIIGHAPRLYDTTRDKYESEKLLVALELNTSVNFSRPTEGVIVIRQPENCRIIGSENKRIWKEINAVYNQTSADI